jgi:hypothetical protein
VCNGLSGAVVPPWFRLPARGKIDFSYLICYCSPVERTVWAVRGGGSFAGGYGASSLPGHGGPSTSSMEEEREKRGFPRGCASPFPYPVLLPLPSSNPSYLHRSPPLFSSISGGASWLHVKRGARPQVRLLTSPSLVYALSLVSLPLSLSLSLSSQQRRFASAAHQELDLRGCVPGSMATGSRDIWPPVSDNAPLDGILLHRASKLSFPSFSSQEK